MKQLIIVWLILTGLLAILSYTTKPYFTTYTDADNDFAHSLAKETLVVLEQLLSDDEQQSGDVFSLFAEHEAYFASWKYAAIRFKGRLAEDFVYGFDLAEEGCRLKAIGKPEGTTLLYRAQTVIRLIAVTDYRRVCLEGR
ncbi:MAG: hypothetical protein P4N59_32795 [Negativicutes bacterium]|nr:hypothetical protein [Negativicutes bacterium]